jgi:hypothetical protein
LRARGFDPETIRFGRPLREIQAEEAERAKRLGLAPPVGYPTLDEIYAQMQAAAAAYPAICRFIDLTEVLGTPTTFEGRHLFAIRISDNVETDENEPKMLVVSNHHARETVTPVIALHAIEQFTTKYGTDAVLTQLVDEYEIWIAATWNPDGYQYLFDVNDFWRKNRRVFPSGEGVDLNRNYPFGWSASCAGSTNINSQTYKGPSPASEPETQTMMALSLDRKFSKVLDFHSFGRYTIWGYNCLNHPFDARHAQEAARISLWSGYGTDARPPSATGEHYQWQQATMGAAAYLIETAAMIFQPSYASALTESAQVFPAIREFMLYPTPIRGAVTDAVTGRPVAAAIEYQGITFNNGERFVSEPKFGRYQLFPPGGSYQILFAAPGYEPQVQAFDVVEGIGQTRDVQLVPLFSGGAARARHWIRY